MLTTLLKQPGETLLPTASFATTAPIAAVVDVAVAARGLVPGAPALTATAAIVAGSATVEIAGGGDGERYVVTIRVRDAEDQELESELDVAVVEASWALPDGGAPYLSIVEFVKKFGFDEVVRMTDESGTGRIDRDLLVGALGDAQAIVEGYLASRYALPLTTVPALVSLAIADIARARLYPRGAPDGVAANATSAEKRMQSVQAGTTPLPVTGTSPPEATTSAPVVFVAGRRRYPDGLEGY